MFCGLFVWRIIHTLAGLNRTVVVNWVVIMRVGFAVGQAGISDLW